MSFDDILISVAKKADKVEKALYKKAPVSKTVAEAAARHNVAGLETLTTWKNLYTEIGSIKLPCPAMTDDEIQDYEDLENSLAVAMNEKKRSQGVIFEYLNALESAHGSTREFDRQIKSWSKGELAGYIKGNPARIAAQLCEFGIDSSAPAFCLDTPKNWTRRGYALKDTARPLFVVTPLFKEEDEKKAEKEGEAIVEKTAENEAGAGVEKKKKKRYSIHALYAPEDVEKVREIPRRSPKKSKNATRAEAMRAEAEKPAQKKKTKSAPAPAAENQESIDLSQLALSL